MNIIFCGLTLEMHKSIMKSCDHVSSRNKKKKQAGSFFCHAGGPEKQ